MWPKYKGYSDVYSYDENGKFVDFSETQIRFEAYNYEPYNFVKKLSQNGSVATYSVSGPLYSVLKETALRGNLR